MEKKNLSHYLSLPYTIHIQSEAEGGFFARVEELNGCMSQGENLEEAARSIRDAMETWLKAALNHHISIPEPETYSGKFVLRLPKSLHRKLAENAKRENLSLNQFVIYLLTEQNTRCGMKSTLAQTRDFIDSSIHNLQESLWQFTGQSKHAGRSAEEVA